ncbi:hypothetical protein VC83_04162 [Pseudogymnoascus destructans]|uniref:HCP-like protein n=1 Tax=Pseudogymnoascus destructans TaxID=655981 RepID=A0A177ADH7_9PEZI|nr:uncharacterized protein VC83_04162 [Pseudogymnoascus destructans]OAF59331.2 hypothetical protein VC83_04162 [Pseudogymnoascus destructans]
MRCPHVLLRAKHWRSRSSSSGYFGPDGGVESARGLGLAIAPVAAIKERCLFNCDSLFGAGGAHYTNTNARTPSPPPEPRRNRLSLSPFSCPRANSATSSNPASSATDPDNRTRRRVSARLHLRRGVSSSNIPTDLPAIDVADDAAEGGQTERERQWEKRATLLARSNGAIIRSASGSPERAVGSLLATAGVGMGQTLGQELRESVGVVGDKKADDNIQEAIRLHESGSLEEATRMFGRLADPGGENNALSQVLYGLALRHGWGCTADPAQAMQYLTAAASNAASIEEAALRAGSAKGGAAKGELVLAIFELANSFRHGWGVKKDPVAAKQYYETAANLGDTDAMNEAGWCYLEGFGCKKDKMESAKYYRLAEKGGNKLIGNGWIWKPKYDPPSTTPS